MKLLRHFFQVPNTIQLIDNSVSLTPVAIKREDHLEVLTEALPNWFKEYLSIHFAPSETKTAVKDLSKIEEVRKRYQQQPPQS